MERKCVHHKRDSFHENDNGREGIGYSRKYIRHSSKGFPGFPRVSLYTTPEF